MRSRSALFAAALIWFAPGSPVRGQDEFDVPLRINFGGFDVVDAAGNTWLGDPGPGDSLGIRPDGLGGLNFIEAWCLVDPAQVAADIGWEPDDPAIEVLRSIRWDPAAEPPDFRLAIPVPDGQYVTRFYFCESCCLNRHHKIEIEGEIVEEDVHAGDYANGLLNAASVLEYRGISVLDGVLDIGLLPCPECFGATDTNAIVSALEVLPDSACDPEDAVLALGCVYDGDLDRVTGRWTTVPGADAYRVLKNGRTLIPSLPAGVTSFTDANPRSEGTDVEYEVQALDGGASFEECRCSVTTFACPRRLVCELDRGSGDVDLSWDGPVGVTVTSYEIFANGVNIDTLGAAATSYVHTPTDRTVTYLVRPVTSPAGSCRDLSCSLEVNTVLFEVPFYLNLGGREITDSRGRVWLADEGVGLDANNVRPDDRGGAEVITTWCTPEPAALDLLGFDSRNADDVDLFRSIRWDNSANPGDYVIEVPVEAGVYDVQLYFCESCCANRHFRVEAQGETVLADVHVGAYADGVFNRPGVLTAREVEVGDEALLTIALLPCLDPECPGGGDGNAILSALCVVEHEPGCGVGSRQCARGLACNVAPNGAVTGSWTGPECLDDESNSSLAGYELWRDGQLLRELPPTATSFTDTLTTRSASYELRSIIVDSPRPCASIFCTATRPEIEFTIPLRINLGGDATIDSRGRFWRGDPGAGADVLEIRPDDLGGTNTITNWCDGLVASFPDSFASLGLDSSHPGDLHIFDSIRWDVGDDDGDGIIGEEEDLDGGDVDYRLAIPVPDGEYRVNLYFTECCCLNRHFRLLLEDDEIVEDLHSGAYSVGGEPGKTGLISVEDVGVADGVLDVVLPPCPFCVGFGDGNAILNAIEVLPAETVPARCPWEFTCALGVDGIVRGTWTPPLGVDVDEYIVLVNGEEIARLDGAATELVEEPPCSRVNLFELVPVGPGVDRECPGLQLRCVAIEPACPFEAPVRINLGGRDTFDSRGLLWVGDPGAGLDVLDIRPDDLGGANVAVDWSLAVMVPASFDELGLDPTHPGDRHIFNTIRWDTGEDGIDYRLELPIEDGEYDISLYFNEQCCPDRHFQIAIENELVDEDVSAARYVPEGEPASLGWLGRLRYPEVTVDDGVLNIDLLPCPDPDCPGATDINAILDALEVVATGGGGPRFARGDADSDGRVALNDGVATLNFLFRGSAEPACLDAADTDDNGRVVLNDAILVFNWLFQGGPAPAQPSPRTGSYPAEDCGEDPTQDALGCARLAPQCR